MTTCRYMRPSEEAYRIEVDEETGALHERPTTVHLCCWAEDAAPAALVGAPRWLQARAVAGYALNYPADCLGCAAYDPAPLRSSGAS